MSRRLSSAIAVLFWLASVSAWARQDQPDYGAPAHVAVVQGTVTLERNGSAEPAVENLPLLQGDRIKTDGGRVEIVLPDGSILDLDRHTTIDLLDGGLLRLPAGRLVFVVARPYGGGEARRDYQVDAPAGSVRFSGMGEYRVQSQQASAGGEFLEVSVVRGEAVIDAEGKSVALRPGERAQVAQGQGVTATGTFNSAATDAFLQWTESLRGERVGSQSNAYLPPDLQVYGGAFDRNGSWDNAGETGWVWYPRVAADWRPYYDGGWYPYAWGWTWVGAGPWVWPTHHYGRWGYGARGWFWIPGAHWGPAWVSWGVGGSYVSWCPLGYRDTPVFGLSFGFTVGGFNAWAGWTVVPHHAFGYGYRVPSHAVHGQGLHAVERVNFAVQRTGPPVPGGGQRGGGGRTAPYDRVQAVSGQRVGSTRGWAAQPSRGGRMAGAAGEGASTSRAPSAPGSGGTRFGSTTYDTRPFSSGSPVGSRYPGAYQSPGGRTSAPSLGSAVPRSAPSRPSESRSPYYYLGPSERRNLPTPSPATPDRAQDGSRGAQTETAVPRGYPNGRSAAPAAPLYHYGTNSPTSSPWTAEPRSSAGGRYYPPSAGQSSPTTRTSSVPDRAAQPRTTPPAWSSPSGASAGSPGPAPSPWYGFGRSPAASSGGASSPGARSGGPGGGSGVAGRPSGGRPSGGLPAGGARSGGGGGGGRTPGNGGAGGRTTGNGGRGR